MSIEETARELNGLLTRTGRELVQFSATRGGVTVTSRRGSTFISGGEAVAMRDELNAVPAAERSALAIAEAWGAA